MPALNIPSQNLVVASDSQPAQFRPSNQLRLEPARATNPHSHASTNFRPGFLDYRAGNYWGDMGLGWKHRRHSHLPGQVLPAGVTNVPAAVGTQAQRAGATSLAPAGAAAVPAAGAQSLTAASAQPASVAGLGESFDQLGTLSLTSWGIIAAALVGGFCIYRRMRK